MKLRFILTALLIIWFFWRLQRLVSTLKGASGNTPSEVHYGHRKTVVETLERCANCGVHVPASQSLLMDDGSTYVCSTACYEVLAGS